MEVTSVYWRHAGFGAFLAVYAAVVARPLLLVGAVGIGAWLLARQYRFVQHVAALQSSLDVAITPAQPRTLTDEAVPVTLAVTVDSPVPVPLDVAGTGPVAADHDGEQTLRIPAGRQEASTTYTVSVPVAGTHSFDSPRVTVTDTAGLFKTEYPAGDGAELLVEPRRPRNLNIGQGGETQVTLYSEDDVGRDRAGFEPDEIREYIFGDPVGLIDWNSTARLGKAHVKSFEAESNTHISLVVDHRLSMSDGFPGGTKFEFAREVALAYLNDSHDSQLSVGLYAVGPGGTTISQPSRDGLEHVQRLRLQLLDLEPESSPEAEGDASTTAVSPSDVSEAEALLADDESPFGRSLSPFFDRAQYTRDLDENPLSNTVRTLKTRVNDSVTTVILTDDTHRTEVRDAVRYGRRDNGRVIVFLTPTVLFEPGGLSNLERAYDRYRQFESFRRTLDGMDGVTAFELAPGDRLDAILAEGRRARRVNA